MTGDTVPALMSAVVVMCSGSFVTTKMPLEIEKFFMEHPQPKNQCRIDQLVENMKANGKFLATLQASELSQWGF